MKAEHPKKTQDCFQHKIVSNSHSDRLAIFLLQLKLNLLQLQDVKLELPHFLQWLKHTSPIENFPNYALVLCYPFSQESFIFHAQDQPLGPKIISSLQATLLPCSTQLTSERKDHIWVKYHQCKCVFLGQNVVIWRVYLDHVRAHPNAEQLDELDEHLTHAFTLRTQQQEQIQHILNNERRDFAADLHDSIAQVLGFLRMKSAHLNQCCQKQEIYADLTQQTEEIATYTHYAYQQVRELITSTRMTHQALDFIAALKKTIHEFEQQSSLFFELDCRVSSVHITPQQTIQLLYIVREGLSNIVRHAHATQACLVIQQQPQLQIDIFDNGRGIQAGEKRHDSFGLEIMHERAQRIGAILKIMPHLPTGTHIYILLEQITQGDQHATI